MLQTTNMLIIRADLLDYNRSAMKKLVLWLLKKANQPVIVGAVRTLGKIDNTWWVIDHVGAVNDALCGLINKKLRKLISADETLNMEAKRLNLKKAGSGMKVEIEFTNVDLDGFLEKLIEALERKSEKKWQEKGEDGLKDAQTMLFHLLHTVNRGVGEEEKFRLLQLLLEWVNKNRLLPQAVESLDEADVGSIEFLELLKAANLKIGDIRLVTDEEGCKEDKQ